MSKFNTNDKVTWKDGKKHMTGKILKTYNISGNTYCDIKVNDRIFTRFELELRKV